MNRHTCGNAQSTRLRQVPHAPFCTDAIISVGRWHMPGEGPQEMSCSHELPRVPWVSLSPIPAAGFPSPAVQCQREGVPKPLVLSKSGLSSSLRNDPGFPPAPPTPAPLPKSGLQGPVSNQVPSHLRGPLRAGCPTATTERSPASLSLEGRNESKSHGCHLIITMDTRQQPVSGLGPISHPHNNTMATKVILLF